MIKTREEFHTKISKEVKEQWDAFLKITHHRIKGASGPELEIAMINHMRKHYFVKEHNENVIKKDTLEKLKIISNGFIELPNSLMKPIVLRGFVKKLIKCKDERTLSKYVGIVIENSNNEIKEGELFPLINVEGFCKFVSSITQKKSIKIKNQ